MGNRKLPFGYKMQLGEIVLHPEESPHVSMIFEQYQRGASFIDLAERMQDLGIAYCEGKSWNKNVIARILEDHRYTGKTPYPMIIAPEQFNAVVAMRAKKQTVIEKTAAQKILRKICDARITSNIEQQVMFLLNGLVEHPELVYAPQTKSIRSPEISMLQRRLDDALARQPIDEALAGQLIRELASAEYNAISSAEYETERIKTLLLAYEPGDELNEVLLQKCVDKVLTVKQTVRLRLKNGQIIEGGAMQ